MPFAPFALQWRTPFPNPPNPTPVPAGVSRTYIPTPSGPLELLSAIPSNPSPIPPIFFAHGGFGCAEIWLQWMQFFCSKGIACYAMSYRGHGKSWYPSFLRMCFTTRGMMAGDLVAGIKFVEGLERERRKRSEDVKVILVAHSAGGGLSQYILSQGLLKVHAFCMCAAVPGFGSVAVYKFWSWMIPFHFPYRLFHPRHVLATTSQVKSAFFSPQIPLSSVRIFEKLLAPYESLLWPSQMLPSFVNPTALLSNIVGWNRSASSTKPNADKLLVLAAEYDVLCTPKVLLDAAERYMKAFSDMVRRNAILEEGGESEGVRFRVVPGVGHHLMNDVEWERGAEEIFEWLQTL
ncbi:alpha/beta-hydrolase [Zopfia rhizophila CBS 207.26]|uniref:Alpha/beta-hydrolase n=1 Tax=Zopfia rhizophila CBS 207.26 TaxID=1314779 RepID=A0A6A6EC38_9PEZI|nr:alpha/beta-hydrolase [Zopfia rhizophila CBS 207.26]